jgi:hypothetical protein
MNKEPLDLSGKDLFSLEDNPIQQPQSRPATRGSLRHGEHLGKDDSEILLWISTSMGKPLHSHKESVKFLKGKAFSEATGLLR